MGSWIANQYEVNEGILEQRQGLAETGCHQCIETHVGLVMSYLPPTAAVLLELKKQDANEHGDRAGGEGRKGGRHQREARHRAWPIPVGSTVTEWRLLKQPGLKGQSESKLPKAVFVAHRS